MFTSMATYGILNYQIKRGTNMIIVNDIQDATTMKNKLGSILRRSRDFGWSKSDIQVELDMIIEDLIKNVNRIDQEMSENEEV